MLVLRNTNDQSLVLMNSKLKEITRLESGYQIGYFNENMALIMHQNKVGIINNKGNIILKPTYANHYLRDYYKYGYSFKGCEV